MEARALSLLHQAGISDAFRPVPYFRIVWANSADADAFALHIHAPRCRRVDDNDPAPTATAPEPTLAAALASADFVCVMMDVPGGVSICPCAEPQTMVHQRRWVYDRAAERSSREVTLRWQTLDIMALVAAIGEAAPATPIATSAGPITLSQHPSGVHQVAPVPWNLEIQDHTRCGDQALTPMPGDAIRLAAPWPWGQLDAGTIGVLGGAFDQPDRASTITFNARTHRSETGVSCGGGPATFHTEWSELRATTDITRIPVWRWKNGWSRAGEGEDYAAMVPVWEWYPHN